MPLPLLHICLVIALSLTLILPVPLAAETAEARPANTALPTIGTTVQFGDVLPRDDTTSPLPPPLMQAWSFLTGKLRRPEATPTPARPLPDLPHLLQW